MLRLSGTCNQWFCANTHTDMLFYYVVLYALNLFKANVKGMLKEACCRKCGTNITAINKIYLNKPNSSAALGYMTVHNKEFGCLFNSA